MKSRVILASCVIALICACQTSPRQEAAMAEVGPVIQFVPAQHKAPATFAEGRYPNLFTSDSYALWVSREVAAAKWEEAMAEGQEIDARFQNDAVTITDDFIIVEANLESAFGDTSIAYDAVGLRNMNVFLQLPNGDQVAPIQQLFVGELREELVGALKKFSRTIVLVFPKRDLWMQRPVFEQDTQEVKLVVSSVHGVYHFMWPAARIEEIPPLTGEERVAAVKVGFEEFFGDMRTLARMFH